MAILTALREGPSALRGRPRHGRSTPRERLAQDPGALRRQLSPAVSHPTEEAVHTRNPAPARYMRSPTLAGPIAAALLLALLAACGDDPASPGKHEVTPTDVDVTFCPGLEPAWVAFQD